MGENLPSSLARVVLRVASRSTHLSVTHVLSTSDLKISSIFIVTQFIRTVRHQLIIFEVSLSHILYLEKLENIFSRKCIIFIILLL